MNGITKCYNLISNCFQICNEGVASLLNYEHVPILLIYLSKQLVRSIIQIIILSSLNREIYVSIRIITKMVECILIMNPS